MTYARGVFVAVGDDGTIAVSSDGAQWDSRDAGVANRLSGVTFGRDRFLTVGDNGVVVSSLFEPASGLELSGSTLVGNGAFKFTITGRAEGTVVVEASPDLRSWVTLTNLTSVSLPADVVDVEASGRPARFFRARSAGQ